MSETVDQSATPQRWALRMTVAGDIRFLSHHDMMRLMVRIARRAGLPLRHTQGFNPHPVMSLPTPRSVGVASEDERLLLSLETPVEAEAMLDALNGQTVAGIKFTAAAEVVKGQCNVPAAVSYRLTLGAEETTPAAAAFEALLATEQWVVERTLKSKRNKRRTQDTKRTKQLDIRPGVREITLDASELHCTLQPVGGAWPRLGELVVLLGLDKADAVGRIVRTHIEDTFPAGACAPGTTNTIPSTVTE